MITPDYVRVVDQRPERGEGEAPPIACVLTREELAGAEDRLAAYRRLGRDGLLAIDREPCRVTLRFRPDPDIRRGVDDLVAAESACCAFLGFDVAEEPGALALTITTPEGGEVVLEDLTHALAHG